MSTALKSLIKVKIGDLCELVNGRAFIPSEWTTHGLPIIRIQNLNDETKAFNYFDGTYNKKHEVNDGDLLFSWSGTPGTSFGAFFWNRGRGVLNQHIFNVLVDKARVEKRYFRYALNSRLNEIIGHAHGGVGLQHITKGKLESVEIPLPPLSEQKRIADILDKADAIRRKRQEAQTEIMALIDSQFLDVFGNPLTNPHKWKRGTFNDHLTLVQYGPRFFNEAYSAVGVRIVRITDLDVQGRLDYSAMPLMNVSEDEKEKSCLRPGDLLLARSGATVGKTALIDYDAPECIAGAYFIRLRFSDAILPLYAQMVLRSKPIQKIIAAKSRQSAQQNFNGPAIRELPLPVPPTDLQAKFCAFHRSCISSGKRLLSATQESCDLFNSLVQRAFKGEL